jgi:choline dehydrogenase-like flavoprotein
MQREQQEDEKHMLESERLEILVLGSGVGGKLIAWHMAQSGRRTAVVERRWVGGSCPNIACNCQLEEDALYTTAAASAPDRDYSGASTFLSHERVITFGGDQRFVWNETTSSRVSTAGLSFSSPPSHGDLERNRHRWLCVAGARRGLGARAPPLLGGGEALRA